jgi:hypothetical protein
VEHRTITRAHERTAPGKGSSHRAFVLCNEAGPGEGGGANRDRTDDLLVANQTLSQLSYGPPDHSHISHGDMLVGLAGVAPATSPLSGVRSN